MYGEISWHVELAVKPKALETLRALTDEMVDFARGEEGVLVYERFVSEDRRTVHVYERFSNSATAKAHLEAFSSKFGERFGRLIERKQFVVFGTPSDALRSMLDGVGATEYLEPFTGFSTLA